MAREKINFNNLNIKFQNFADYYNNSQPEECPQHSYKLLPDVEIAIDTVEKFKNKKIIIYGDYDCDGITATVTMLKGLKYLGFPFVDYYIPHRVEGYGMNQNSVNKIIRESYDLVITVDTGITSVDFTRQFKEAGVEVIITDHHEPLRDGTLPPAKAVIDCKRQDSTYPFRDICGCVVAYKFIKGLFDTEGKPFPEDVFLPLATMGTVADVMPLTDENRTIVKNGLEIIHKNPAEAFKKLTKAIDKYSMLETMKASDIAFYIGPLINASSRVGELNFSVKLLQNSDNEAICEECSRQLAEYNEYRRKITADIESHAADGVKNFYPNLSNHKVPVVIAGREWNKGVVGIVASHIVETYGVPAIVLSLVDDKLTGSARSINDISMIAMLDYCKDILTTYGGHTGAAGLSLPVSRINEFRQRLCEYSDKFLNAENYRVIHDISAKLSFPELTLDNFHLVDNMEPFGEGNPQPRFYSELYVNAKNIIGSKQDTLKINFGNGTFTTVEGIMFKANDYLESFNQGEMVKVIYTLGNNVFRGNEKLQLNIQAIERL